MIGKALDFFIWIILGGFLAVGYAFYEMLWLSPRGLDKVSIARRDMLK